MNKKTYMLMLGGDKNPRNLSLLYRDIDLKIVEARLASTDWNSVVTATTGTTAAKYPDVILAAYSRYVDFPQVTNERAFLRFNLQGIEKTITAAKLYLYDTQQTSNVYIYKGLQTGDITTADYDNFSTQFSGVSTIETNYNAVNLNAAAITELNLKSITSIVVRTTYDVDNVRPTIGSEFYCNINPYLSFLELTY